MKKIILKIRTKFYSIYHTMVYGKKFKHCTINSFCKFNGNESLGTNVNFNGCKIYGHGIVTFGDNFHSAAGLKIITSFHNYKGEAIPYDKTLITKDVTIEENVWIGMDVKILGGVHIGEGSIIQAGSVVVKTIPKYSICGGNPATVFLQRDIEKYEKLKKLNRVL
jgi:acetyltransferase-like isoleucine patch superfamily enzyme